MESLENRVVLAAQPVISEFMAANKGGLLDGYGESSDWIEIYNVGDQSIDLAGWHLTDDSNALDKWTFPSVTLDVGAYLIVFASDHSSTTVDPSSYFHANFKLDDAGEYLALVEPDGTTVAHEFAPSYPEQVENIAYGFIQEATQLLASTEEPLIGSIVDLLSVDFQNTTASAVGVTQSGFETFDNTAGGSASYSTEAGNVVVALSGLDASVGGLYNRGGVANGGSLTMADVYNDFAFKNGATGGGGSPQSMTMTLSGDGIAAETDYQLTFYAYDSDALGGSHSVAYAGISGTAGSAGPLLYNGAVNPTADGEYSVAGTFTSDATGTLTVRMTDTFSGASSKTGVRLNAFHLARIDESSTPGEEPLQRLVLVPDSSDAGLGAAWTLPSFVIDDDWHEARFGIGFNVNDEALSSRTAYGNLVGAAGSQDYAGSLGHDFDVLHTIVVTELGVFDSGANGLARSLTAEIWSREGVLLASSTFTPAESGELVGSDRFKPLDQPLTLTPGSYTVVAHGYGPGESNGNEGKGGPYSTHKTLDDGGGLLAFVGAGRFGDAGAFPTQIDGGPANRYSAGTFRYESTPYSSLIETDMTDQMLNQNASALVRIEFEVENPTKFDWLLLRMKYDDGFVAYLNGVEVARRNAPDTLSWNSHAESARPPSESMSFENISLTEYLGELTSGVNVLAIHALNVDLADEDFLMLPELLAGTHLDSRPRYLDPPTPGAPNDAPFSFVGFVADTTFDVDRGFFSASDLAPGGVLEHGVTIASSTPGATIRYTTDGSQPTETTGVVYTGPVPINTTTTLRAAAFLDDYRPTNVDTHTYIFLEDVLAQSADPIGFPTTWNGVSPDYALEQDPANLARIAGDPELTPPQYNSILVDSLRSLPTMSIVMDVDDLFGSNGIYANPQSEGDAWERPASVEYILPDGTTGFQIDAGIQIMGYISRDPALTPKHSLRLVFKSEYGASRLEYPLFPDSPVDSFNTIALRANSRDTWASTDGYSGAYSTYIRDQWAKQAQAAMGQPATAGNFVHLYFNGLYWGLYNPTERPDAAFLADRIGGDDEDFDAVKFCCPDRAVDGDLQKWDQLLSLAGAGLGSAAAYQYIQGNNPDGTRNENYDVLLDVDSLIDFIINGQYHATADWPGNYYAVRERGPDSEGFKFFTWDNDIAFPLAEVNRDKTASDGSHLWTESPGVLDMALRQNAEYRLRFADHVHRHLFNDGVYTPEAAAALWSSIADQIDEALVAESARWGDVRGELFTPSQDWRPAIDDMLDNYFPVRTDVVLAQLRSRGLYPSVDAPEFVINAQAQHGGLIVSGDVLTMIEAAGDTTIYYTIDGSDPRMPGGAVSSSAVLYAGAFPVFTTSVVSARVLDGGQWSALSEARFTVEVPLRVAEIMYNPTGDDDEAAEYIELVNVSGNPIPLAGIEFVEGSNGGIAFVFDPSESTLAPDERIVVVRDQANFLAAYGADGIRVALGQYQDENHDSALSNGGETITLVDAAGGLIQQFTFDDAWHPETDDGGYSLVVIDVRGDYNDPLNWRPSAALGGSPGKSDPEPLASDFNGSGMVDRRDLALLVRGYGKSTGAVRIDGDANRDHAVTLVDLALTQATFGASVASPTAPAPSLSRPPSVVQSNREIASLQLRARRTNTSILARRIVDQAIGDGLFETTRISIQRRLPSTPHRYRTLFLLMK